MISNNDKEINKVMEKMKDNNEAIETLYKLLENGNLKYFKCLINSFKNQKEKKK